MKLTYIFGWCIYTLSELRCYWYIWFCKDTYELYLRITRSKQSLRLIESIPIVTLQWGEINYRWVRNSLIGHGLPSKSLLSIGDDHLKCNGLISSDSISSYDPIFHWFEEAVPILWERCILQPNLSFHASAGSSNWISSHNKSGQLWRFFRFDNYNYV